MSDCVTLDMRRITSKGIVSGTHSFNPPPLADMRARFGTAPAGDSGADAQAASQAEALEALAAALAAAEAAAERQAAARAVRNHQAHCGFLPAEMRRGTCGLPGRDSGGAANCRCRCPASGGCARGERFRACNGLLTPADVCPAQELEG